jgi:signal peptide peptidase SppA
MKHYISKAIESSRPIMMDMTKANAIVDVWKTIDITVDKKASEVRDMLELMFGKPREMEMVGNVAVIPIQGVIGKNLSDLEKLCGSCDVDDISEWVQQAEANPDVHSVVFDINSPGGTTAGVPELADQIFGMKKPTMAYTDTECLSAAYYLGSQAKRLCASPSADVVNAGVYIAFADVSEAYKMEGVKMEVIKSGEYKAIGMEGTSLSDKQRKMLQDDVNETHDAFKEAVKRSRKFAKDDDMEGQTYTGKKAAEKGLVTGVYATMADAIMAG